MTDLVNRLRTENSMMGYYDSPAIQIEAANEMERLHAEIERLRAAFKEERVRADTLYDAIYYGLEHSREGLPWLGDWFHGEPDARRELDKWRVKYRAALGKEKK